MDAKEIITTLMYTGLQVHIFHLQTTSYAEHMALGDLYEAIEGATDKFAEALIGSEKGNRPKLATQLELTDYSEGVCHPFVEQFADWLTSMDGVPTDVLNMRDDLLAVTHKTRYLLSLDGEEKEEEAEEVETEPTLEPEPMPTEGGTPETE